MRIISSFSDANTVIKPVLDFLSLFKTKDYDHQGLRLKNNGDAVDPQDYVTLKQLSSSTSGTDLTNQYFTVVFAFPGVPAASTPTPNWVTGINREGLPIEIWARCNGAPRGGVFQCNVLLNGVALLTNYITINDTNVHHSSSFVNPVPQLGRYSTLVPQVPQVNSASDISIGVVIKRGS